MSVFLYHFTVYYMHPSCTTEDGGGKGDSNVHVYLVVVKVVIVIVIVAVLDGLSYFPCALHNFGN